MHSTTYKCFLVLLPLFIATCSSLPDNIFGKRGEFIPALKARWGGTSGSSQGKGGQGPPCMAQGWEACMSQMCASQAQTGSTGGGTAVPVAGTSAAVSVATKKRRHLPTMTSAAAAGITNFRGPGPATPIPSAGAGRSGSRSGSGNVRRAAGPGHGGDPCVGFSDFIKNASGSIAGPQVTDAALPATDTATSAGSAAQVGTATDTGTPAVAT